MSWNVPVFDSTGLLKDSRNNITVLTASGAMSISVAISSGVANVPQLLAASGTTTLSLAVASGVVSNGGVINAASASQSDVEAAIALAVAGDTVQVPAGTATWNALAVNKQITLAGAGVTTDITCQQCTLVKQATGNVRLTGFKFTRASFSPDNQGGWVISGAESYPGFIIDNIESYSDVVLWEIGTNGGLFHTVTFRNDGAPDIGSAHIVLKQPGANSSFQLDPIYGTDATNGIGVTYIEDCIVYGVADDGTEMGNNSSMLLIDIDAAARVVIRNTDLYETAIGSHGEATSNLSCRHWEMYDNNFYYRNEEVNHPNGYIWMRGGSGLIYNNYFDNPASGTWGDAGIKMSIRTVDEVKYACGYPHLQQLGWGWDESAGPAAYAAEGIYYYGNTWESGTSTFFTDPPNFEARDWGTGCTSDLWGDYIAPIWNETTRPGYTALAYPHPLRT